MKEIVQGETVYKNGDWVVLLSTPHGGYSIGDVYQIHEITDKTGTFSAYKKRRSDKRDIPEIQSGFSICCHRKAEPHEIPDIINNTYQIF